LTATVSRAFDSAPLPVKQQECVPRSPRSATCANARVIAELTRSPRRAVADLRCGPGEDRRRSSPRHGKSTSWAPAPVLAGRRSPTAPPPCRWNEERRPRAANCAPVAGAAITISSVLLPPVVPGTASATPHARFSFFVPACPHGVGRAGWVVYLVACLCLEIWVAGRSAFAHAQ